MVADIDSIARELIQRIEEMREQKEIEGRIVLAIAGEKGTLKELSKTDFQEKINASKLLLSDTIPDDFAEAFTITVGGKEFSFALEKE